MSVELRHLRYFLMVAEELHFARAAARLHIAQPSLSQQIRKLEREIGAELFTRGHRRIELTSAGEALMRGAARTLEDAESAVNAAREADQGITGHLTLGFIETAAIRIVPEAVRRFRASRPRVGLSLRELGVEEQIDGVLSGRLDLGFIRARSSIDGLVTEPILEEDLVAVVPSGHHFESRETLTMGEVAGEPLIAVERGVLPALYDETVLMLRDHPGGRIAQNASSVLAVLGLVAAGLGLALLPASVRDLNLSGTVFVDIDSSPRATILAIHRQQPGSIHVGPFLEAIRGQVDRNS